MKLFSNMRRLNERPPELIGEYQIREMYPQDFPAVIGLLQEFGRQPSLRDLPQIKSPEILLKRILNGGLARIYEHRLHGVCGVVLGMQAPNIWNSDIQVMTELAYYIKTDARSWRSGYTLLKSYLDACKALKVSGKIQYYMMASLEIDFDYSRFGLIPVERIWRG